MLLFSTDLDTLLDMHGQCNTNILYKRGCEHLAVHCNLLTEKGSLKKFSGPFLFWAVGTDSGARNSFPYHGVRHSGTDSAKGRDRADSDQDIMTSDC